MFFLLHPISLPAPIPKRSATLHIEYRPDIDGLRAVAALAVVGGHAGLFPGGGIGVDVFFVISGYLISGIILRELARGRFSAFDFYARRVKRIFPALIFVLAATWGLGWLTLLPDEYQQLGKYIATGAAFAVNILLYADAHEIHPFLYNRAMLAHLWSLGVEEQFYILWPIFLIATWKLGKGLFVLMIVATTVSFTLNIVVTSWDWIAAYCLPWNRLWELSLGGTLAYAQLGTFSEPDRSPAPLSARSLSRLRLHSRHVLGLIGAALIMAPFFGLLDNRVFPGWWALVPAIGAFLLLSAGPQSLINHYVLRTPPMVFIGLISYPLYLWHVPLLTIGHILERRLSITPATTVGAVTMSFVLAYLTYRYIELPLRSPRSSRHTNKIATILCAVMALCGAVGYLTLRGISPRADSHGIDKFVQAATEDWLTETGKRSWTPTVDGFLTLGTGPRRVLFIGDSNMQQYYPRISKILSDHPLNAHSAVFAVREGCAPAALDIADFVTESVRVACATTIQNAVEYARDPKVDTVVIAACWYLYFVTFGSFDHFGEAGALKPGTDSALESLARMITEFVRAGKRVYIVLNVPIGLAFDPRQMILRTILPPGFTVAIHSPKKGEILTAVSPIASKLLKLAQSTGAHVIDPVEFLCNATTCPAVSPRGEPIYHDTVNLRPSYARDNARYLDETVIDANTDSGAARPLVNQRALN